MKEPERDRSAPFLGLDLQKVAKLALAKDLPSEALEE
jgi:hypothetical protein